MVVWVFQTLDFGVEFLHSWLSVIFMGSLCVVIGGNFVSTMCKSMSKGEKDIFSFVTRHERLGRDFMWSYHWILLPERRSHYRSVNRDRLGFFNHYWMKLAIIYFFRCHYRYWFLHRSSARRSNRLKSLHDPQDGVGRRAFGRYIQHRCMSALSCYLFRTIRLTTILIACWLTACTSSAIQIFVWGGVNSGSKSQKSLKSSTSKSGFGHQAFQICKHSIYWSALSCRNLRSNAY